MLYKGLKALNFSEVYHRLSQQSRYRKSTLEHFFCSDSLPTSPAALYLCQ